jgi:dephospho-CoA kinase
MPVIGITGGLATGKSTVAALFRERGAVVFSADEAAREVVQPGSAVLQAIAETFGPQYLLPSGELDRSAMGALVFSDPEALRRLESITHPAIQQRLREQVDKAKRSNPEAVIAVEVPLLYEAGMEEWFDKVVVVKASEETQLARLMNRNALSEREARRRIASQMPLAEKVGRADIVVHNDGDAAVTASQVGRIMAALLRART